MVLLCYTFIMAGKYWQKWEAFLSAFGLYPKSGDLFSRMRPLFSIVAQVMMLGIPLVKLTPWGEEYIALIEMLSDEDMMSHFTDDITRESV